ncbi:hypothetical protein D6T64_11870 [Cryobacterium melibiosiphilum]|uniref:Uncharacterized protein n=1 Tax=Cryobacterium melibiosiphilum TaxID=995039 RepID=A0A3A5MD76_9MICO|nr:hypothetical protein D6T64_11870 [Cryobacterium melibiosiphilum]
MLETKNGLNEIGCNDCPEFADVARGQSSTIDACRHHDRCFHPQIGNAKGGPKTRSLTDAGWLASVRPPAA